MTIIRYAQKANDEYKDYLDGQLTMQTEQLKGGMFLWLIVGCFAQFIVGEVDYKQNALNLFRSILPWSNSASCKCR